MVYVAAHVVGDSLMEFTFEDSELRSQKELEEFFDQYSETPGHIRELKETLAAWNSGFGPNPGIDTFVVLNCQGLLMTLPVHISPEVLEQETFVLDWSDRLKRHLKVEFFLFAFGLVYPANFGRFPWMRSLL